MKNYEYFDHTADVGVRIRAQSLPDLFVNSALALFELIIDYQPQKKVRKEVVLQGETMEDLLVAWLNELVGQFFADKFLPAEYNVVIEDQPEKKTLRATIQGQAFDPYENKINREVKAATYHNLRIERKGQGYQVEVIFDV